MPLNQTTAFRILLAALMLQVISIGYYTYYVYFHGYLPAPFVADKWDTFMDLYNTIWWGAHDGRYTEWRSIYPPLNFIFVGLMRALFAPSGVGSDPVYLRATSLWPAYTITALHVIAPAFIVTRSTWSGFSKINRALIALIAVLSPIFLFSVERGNLIILSIFLLPFIFAERDGWWKPLLLAIVINLKPYFVLLVFGYAFVGDWRRFLQALAFSGAIFLLSGLLEDPNFLLFVKNIKGFADSAVLQPRPLLALPASPSALTRAILIFLNNAGSDAPKGLIWSLLPPLIEAVKTGAIVLALFGLFRSRHMARPNETFVLFLIMAVTAGIWAGGYSQVFYLAAVPVFMTMRFRNAYLLLLIAIFLPWDLVTLYTDPPAVSLSFITDRIVSANWQLGLGSLVRPFLNIALIATLGAELLKRKVAPAGLAMAKTRAIDLIPDWRFVLPAGMAGLVIGTALYYLLAISAQTATAVVQMTAGTEQRNAGQFLHDLLKRRTTPQSIVAQLQTVNVTNRIAREIGAPELARSLAGRQYGGDGGLTPRLTGDARYLEIRIILSDPVVAVRAADIAADIATQIDETAHSISRAQANTDVAANWQNIGIVRAIAPVIDDRLVDLPIGSLPSQQAMTNLTKSHDKMLARAAIFQPATLSTPMIDSWWLGALIGAVACGSLGYAVSLSQVRGKATA